MGLAIRRPQCSRLEDHSPAPHSGGRNSAPLGRPRPTPSSSPRASRNLAPGATTVPSDGACHGPLATASPGTNLVPSRHLGIGVVDPPRRPKWESWNSAVPLLLRHELFRFSD